MPRNSPTALLDYRHPDIERLIAARDWRGRPGYEQIRSIYDFVRNEIVFGYNARDAMPASAVLREGYGQCNTKAILIMALLRACDLPTRLRAFTLNKKMQAEMLGLLYPLTPREIIHTWAEVEYDGKWQALEGVILDKPYLAAVQTMFADVKGPFCGWAVGAPDLQNPAVEWNNNDTFIQKEGIISEIGVFDTPDAFFATHTQKMGALKTFLYAKIGRRYMNSKVSKVRKARIVG